MAIKAIFFDIGNVLFGVDMIATYLVWAKGDKEKANAMMALAEANPLYRKIECGLISPEEFAAGLSELFDIQMDQTFFEEGWNAIFCPALEGIQDLLKSFDEEEI